MKKFEIRFNGKFNGRIAFNCKVVVELEYYSDRDAHIAARKQGYIISSKIFEWNVL